MSSISSGPGKKGNSAISGLIIILYNLGIMTQTEVRQRLRVLSLRWLVGVAVGLLALGWIFNTPEGLLGKADAIGYAVCHRIEVRSFHIGDRPLPLCARCSGMYLGALVGLVYQAFIGRRRAGMPVLPVVVVLLGFIGAFAVDGGNSFLALLFQRGLLYPPSNPVRLFTGTGMGLVIASALFPAFNQTVWQNWDEKPALGSFKAFAGMVLAAVMVDILVLTEQPAILYVLALASTAAVLLILTMLYAMVFLMATRQENQFMHVSGLSFALLVGFGVGLLQIGFLDLVRYWLTGTWDGFHFG